MKKEKLSSISVVPVFLLVGFFLVLFDSYVLKTVASVEHRLASFQRAFSLFEKIKGKRKLKRCDECYKRVNKCT